MKWYHKIFVVLLVIVLSPLLLVGLIAMGIDYLVELPRSKRLYYNAPYYKDLQLPFALHKLGSPEFIFYNSAIERKLPIRYVCQDDGFEYFIYEGTVYLFPNFDQICYDGETGQWEAYFDGDGMPLHRACEDIVSQLEDRPDDLPVRILVARKMIDLEDLKDSQIPEPIFVTWDYDTAFENEDDPLKWKIPTDAQALFEMMQRIPDLCGTFRVEEDGKLRWNLYEDFFLEIGVDPMDCYVEVNRKRWGISEAFTHWHPTVFELYETVRQLGTCGNVLVLHRGILSTGVLYSGSPLHCPYSPDKKPLLSKRHYLVAKNKK